MPHTGHNHNNKITRPTHVSGHGVHSKAKNRISMPRKAKKGSKRS